MLTKFINLYTQIILENRKDIYIEQLNNKHIDNSNQLAEYIFAFNNPKKEKVALYWLLKGSIELPKDQDKLDQAFNLIDKQHLNYQEFNSPNEVINRDDKSTQKLNTQYEYNPDQIPEFTNKKELDDGVVVYQVENSKEGEAAVRNAVDICWGKTFNNWCLINRHVDNWKFWQQYDAYPKRIAFKNGKLLAFCANDEPKLAWWDKNNNSSEFIPETTSCDDIDFLKKYIKNYKIYFVKHPNCPKDILRNLSNDEDINIIYYIAKNPNCPMDILTKLSNDKNWGIRSNIASNPNCPYEILEKLSNDKDYNVLNSFLKNPNCPPEILEKLSKYAYLASSIINHPNCPKKILQKFINDKDKWIRDAAKRKLTISKD